MDEKKHAHTHEHKKQPLSPARQEQLQDLAVANYWRHRPVWQRRTVGDGTRTNGYLHGPYAIDESGKRTKGRQYGPGIAFSRVFSEED
jgi:hypothetical protein